MRHTPGPACHPQDRAWGRPGSPGQASEQMLEPGGSRTGRAGLGEVQGERWRAAQPLRLGDARLLPLFPSRQLPAKAPGQSGPGSLPADQAPAAAGGSKLPVPPPSGSQETSPHPPEGIPRASPVASVLPHRQHPRPPRRHASPGHRACATGRRRAGGTRSHGGPQCGAQSTLPRMRRSQPAVPLSQSPSGSVTSGIPF